VNECCANTIRDGRKFRLFDYKFCSACGTRVIRECACQKEIFVDTKFCPFCGRDKDGNRAGK